MERRTGADSAYKTKRHTREQLVIEWKEANLHCGKERGGIKVAN